MTDLAYFLYTSIHSDLLNTNLDELLRLYFDSFSKVCQEFDAINHPIKTHQGVELTWEYFQDEWKKYKIYGQVFALLLIPIMYANPEKTPDMENLDEADLSLRNEDTKGNFDEMWSYKPMQDKLFNLIFTHLLH